MALLADAPVADVDDPVCDARRRRVVADDHCRGAVLGDELREKRQDDASRLRVEIAGRLVGDHEPRAMRQRRTDRDPLLLASRELGRAGVRAIE